MSERIDLTEAPLPRARRQVVHGNGRGTGLPKLDEFALRLLGLSAAASALFLLYLFWGLLSGAWSHEAMGQLGHVARAQQMANIALVFQLLQYTSFAMIAALLVCCAKAEGVGYWLLGGAAFFAAGIPFLTEQVYGLTHHTAGAASQAVLDDFHQFAWLFGVPGVIWTVVDIARRLAAAAEIAAVQRANAKYGHGVQKQQASTQRQVFLGRCWEGPFCKDHIRAKCPIFIEKRGPCWKRKEGCMCEERIVLQAMIAPDWKDQMTRANMALSMGTNARKVLTPAAKRERCRSCIIYNEHQRQKHKALTTLTLIGIPTFLVLNFAWIQHLVNQFLNLTDAAAKRFAFSADPTGIGFLHNGSYDIFAWTMVFVFAIVLLSQALKLVEYLCFTLKI
ncbi:MAG: hypothetical protein ACRYFS_16955 [Janthinobacterium lividum]